MLFSIIIYPLLFSLIVGVLGRLFGGKGSYLLSDVGLFINVVITFFFGSLFISQQMSFHFQIFSWISFIGLKVDWVFCFDSISIIMFLVVNSVSCVVHFFSSSYMSNDPHLTRFMSYISFFTMFMLILVTSDNLLQLFLGWEGVGLCSYLLISFWYTRVDALSSGLKALIVNRISDFILLCALLCCILFFNSLDFPIILSLSDFFIFSYFYITNDVAINCLFISCLFILGGAMGKSAQILLHTWLPDAMEGPTPVSALIHAATMVTAGIFLILRCSALFEYVHIALLFLLLIGGLTAFVSGTIGVAQFDIKKVIAYSTCSQLGYMLVACGASNFFVSFFHLMNHAFFKALLFLCAGCIIHSCNGEQDFRAVGGITRQLPIIFIFMLVGGLALGGFAFLTGFYSKDFILEQFLFMKSSYDLGLLWSCAVFSVILATLLTAFYTVRLFIAIFFKIFNNFLWFLAFIHESSMLMTYPLLLLFLGSLYLGFLFNDFFIGVGNVFLSQNLTIFCYNGLLFETELISQNIKLIIFIIVLLISFSLIAFLNFKISSIFIAQFTGNLLIKSYFWLFNSKWFFDVLYNRFINIFVFNLAFYLSYELFDKLLLERFFGHFTSLNISKLTYVLVKRVLQSGYISNYFLILFLSTFVVFSSYLSLM